MWEYIWNICIITHLLFTSVRKLVYAWKSALDTSLHPKVTNPWLLKLTKIQVAFSIVLKIFNAHFFLWLLQALVILRQSAALFILELWKCFVFITFDLGKWSVLLYSFLLRNHPPLHFLFSAERKQSLGYDWHPECLRCEECGKRLNPGQHAEVSQTNDVLFLLKIHVTNIKIKIC